MKKSLLTILCAVAMVATANADNAPVKGQKAAKTIDATKLVKMANVQEWPADKELPTHVQEQMKAQKAQAAAKANKISSLKDLEKGYDLYTQAYTANPFAAAELDPENFVDLNSFSYIMTSGRSGIKIYNFTYGFDVEGTVDVAEGIVELPAGQVVANYNINGSAEPAPLVLAVLFVHEDGNVYYTLNYSVYGYAAEDGNVVFDNMNYLECYFYVVGGDGEYAGYTLNAAPDFLLSTTLTPSNNVALQIDAVEPEDEMATDFEYTYTPVVVTRDGNTLTIDNFGGYDLPFTATITEAEGGLFDVAIPSQLCGSATGGDFFTYGIDVDKWNDDDLWEVATTLHDFATENDDIVGLAEGTTIELGPWCQYSPAPAYAQYTWDGMRYGTTIQLNTPLSDMTGINSVNNATAKSNEWYTINGVRLSGKPAVKGLYINNGKKVLVK